MIGWREKRKAPETYGAGATMRHRKTGRRLNKSAPHRLAMFRNMVTSLLLHEHIQTTDAKAKELRRFADRMITLGKRGTLHARRQALSYVRSRSVVKKLFEEIAPRFESRPGGYTRITKLGIRLGDAAPISLVELTDRGDRSLGEAEKKRERRRRSTRKKEEAAEARPPGV
jgi:large subunit ribosomal protein L17